MVTFPHYHTDLLQCLYCHLSLGQGLLNITVSCWDSCAEKKIPVNFHFSWDWSGTRASNEMEVQDQKNWEDKRSHRAGPVQALLMLAWVMSRMGTMLDIAGPYLSYRCPTIKLFFTAVIILALASKAIAWMRLNEQHKDWRWTYVSALTLQVWLGHK